MGGLLVCVIMCAVRDLGSCYQRAEERRGVHFNQMQLQLSEERLSWPGLYTFYPSQT